MKKTRITIVLIALVALLASCASSYDAHDPKYEGITQVALEVDPTLYTEEVVNIQANGRITVGTLTRPVSAKENVPAVVMLHGTGSNRDEAGSAYVYASRAMAAAGIASLRIDFVGSGDSTESYVDYNFTTAEEDAIAAKNYLKRVVGIDGKRIGLMGWSQGGTNAITTVARDKDFKSVVLWAGALDLTGVADKTMYEEAKKQGYATLEFDWRDSLPLGIGWFEDVYEGENILRYVEKIKAPILAINGEIDEVVPPQTGKMIKDFSTNEKSMQLIIPNADHTFNVFYENDLETLSLTVGSTIAWFKETL